MDIDADAGSQPELPNPNRPDPSRICVVTVTYGNRIELLERSIEAAARAGVVHWVVVCNGAASAVKAHLHRLVASNDRDLVIVEEPRNTGSAGGFAAGITAALALPHIDHIWLLDDDNGPRPEALKELMEAYEALSREKGGDEFALSSLRSDRPISNQIAAGVAAANLYARPDSILGFQLAASVIRLFKRATGKATPRPASSSSNPPARRGVWEIPYAPYSGLFASRPLFERIGLPNEKFVLYGDDYEFTSRIAAADKKLLLVPQSVIDDFEPSWHRNETSRNVFERLLSADSDFRVYYTARNDTYWSKTRARRPYRFWINKTGFVLIAWAYSVLTRRRARFKLIRRAIADGVAGRLGVNDEFTLP